MGARAARPRAAVGLIGLLAAACAPAHDDRPQATAGIRLVDAAGTEVLLAAPAARVVSLVPSATETLRAMGRESVLVGRTDFDTTSWVAPLPSVGGGLEPNLEAIVALAPDLVVYFAGEQDTRTPARLRELGVPALAVRPDRIGDIFRTMEILGDAIGARPGADSLAQRVRDGLNEAADKVRPRPRVRVAYVLGGTPPWVAGPGTYIDEVVSLMGGDNVFRDLGRLYAPVSPEELRSRDIDVVLVSGAASLDPSLVPGARIEDVGGVLEIPGPGVVEAAWLIAERIHGRPIR